MQYSTKRNWFWTINTPDQRDRDQIGIVLERTALSGSDLLFCLDKAGPPGSARSWFSRTVCFVP